MIEIYIKDLLYAYDCVVIPGFGGFITNYSSADIHPVSNKFIPPVKKIAFNGQLINNDGVLIGYVAEVEGVETELATQMVENFVSSLKENLKRYNQYFFKGIGGFFYNADGELEFEPENKINYLDDSFGLSELYFKPIDRDSNMAKVPTRGLRPPVKKVGEKPEPVVLDENGNPVEKEKNRGLKIILVLLPILVLGGAGAFLYNQNNANLSSVFPFDLFHKNESLVSDKVEPLIKDELLAENAEVIENEAESDAATGESAALVEETYQPEHKNIELPADVPAKAAEPVKAPAISDKSGRYFIVVGSFSKRDNAYRLKNKFDKEGIDATLIKPSKDNRFYKVAVADFSDKDEAISKLEDYKAKYGNSIWVMSF